MHAKSVQNHEVIVGTVEACYLSFEQSITLMPKFYAQSIQINHKDIVSIYKLLFKATNNMRVIRLVSTPFGGHYTHVCISHWQFMLPFNNVGKLLSLLMEFHQVKTINRIVLACHNKEAFHSIIMDDRSNVFKHVLFCQIECVLWIFKVSEYKALIATNYCFILIFIKTKEIWLRIKTSYS